MKNKLPKKAQKPKKEQASEQEISDKSQQKEQELNFVPKMLKKQALFVTFSGVIQLGSFHQYQTLALQYTIIHGNGWIKVAGEKSALSQIASSNGKYIVWNLPFEVSYETTEITGWPQLIIVVYGTDMIGRSTVKGYGNVHLPCSSGIQNRKIRVFQPLPQSIITGFFGYLSGSIAQFKQPQKVLGNGEGREVTRVKTVGQIKFKVQTTRYNFAKHNYQ